jgi:hypothetical protein
LKRRDEELSAARRVSAGGEAPITPPPPAPINVPSQQAMQQYAYMHQQQQVVQPIQPNDDLLTSAIFNGVAAYLLVAAHPQVAHA